MESNYPPLDPVPTEQIVQLRQLYLNASAAVFEIEELARGLSQQFPEARVSLFEMRARGYRARAALGEIEDKLLRRLGIRGN